MVDLPELSAASVRRCFAATALPADPLNVITYPGSETWPASLQQQLAGTLIPAGVLIPIFDRPRAGLSLLLTQRSAALRIHAGQISFPGGRMEPDDADIEATALRETHEEVGIGGESISVVGYLDPMPTMSGYAVTPIVGLVDAAVSIALDQNEVEYSFEVPLQFLLDDNNRQIVQRELHGKTFPMVEFHYAEHRIWGATAMMIIQFIKMIKKK